MNYIFADSIASWLIPIILVAFFGVIVLIVILVKRHTKLFSSHDKPKSQQEIANEELDRILQPVEDKKTAEQMEKFANEDEKKAASGAEAPKGEDKPIDK